MTVAFRTNPAKEVYEIDFITDNQIFDIPFAFLETPEYLDVHIRHNDSRLEKLTIGVDYNIIDITKLSGRIQILDEYKNIRSLTISRNIRMSQDTRYNSQTIFSNTIEKDLDKLCMIMQDSNFILRTIHAAIDNNENETSVIDKLELPSRVDRTGKVLSFDGLGTLIVKQLSELMNAIRQPLGEEPDDTFEIPKAARINKWITFDNKGSVVLQYLPSAGENIHISNNNVISAVDTKYTAGVNVNISNNNVISAVDTKYTADYGIEILANNAIKITPAKTGDNDDCFGGVVISDIPDNLIYNDNGYISVIIPLADEYQNGLMSLWDKTKLNSISDVGYSGNYNDLNNKPSFKEPLYITDDNNVFVNTPINHQHKPGVVYINSTGAGIVLDMDADGGINSYLLPPQDDNIGGVKADNTTISIDYDGTIHALTGKYTAGKGIDIDEKTNTIRLKNATALDPYQLGGIYSGALIENDLLAIEPDGQTHAILPPASRYTLGGIKTDEITTFVDQNGVLSSKSKTTTRAFVPKDEIIGSLVTKFIKENRLNIHTNSVGYKSISCFTLNDGTVVYLRIETMGEIYYSYDAINWSKSNVENYSYVSGVRFCVVGDNIVMSYTASGNQTGIRISNNRGVSFTGSFFTSAVNIKKMISISDTKVVAMDYDKSNLFSFTVFLGKVEYFFEVRLEQSISIKDILYLKDANKILYINETQLYELTNALDRSRMIYSDKDSTFLFCRPMHDGKNICILAKVNANSTFMSYISSNNITEINKSVIKENGKELYLKNIINFEGENNTFVIGTETTDGVNVFKVYYSTDAINWIFITESELLGIDYNRFLDNFFLFLTTKGDNARYSISSYVYKIGE